MDIHINSFVRRQTKNSPFSYWTCDDTELLRRIEAGWENRKPGYRDGVTLVPIDPEGCYSGIVQLKAGDKLVGEYSARKAGEEPRKHTYAVGEKMPAKTCYVVLYRHDVLAEGKENETDKEWEMVSFNASPTTEEPPISSGTLMANHFKLSGGTDTRMSDSEFVAALKVSVEYWKDKAMAAPKTNPTETMTTYKIIYERQFTLGEWQERQEDIKAIDRDAALHAFRYGWMASLAAEGVLHPEDVYATDIKIRKVELQDEGV